MEPYLIRFGGVVSLSLDGRAPIGPELRFFFAVVRECFVAFGCLFFGCFAECDVVAFCWFRVAFYVSWSVVECVTWLRV